MTKPFPENQIRDFYAGQARHYLDNRAQLPKLLPEFPGLDGGSFGYWGQNPEADNYDYRLNEMDKGPVVSQVTDHFGKRTHRAILAKAQGTRGITTLFDAEKLTFTDAWEGGFVEWASRRYGMTTPIRAKGKQIQGLQSSRWEIPTGTQVQFLGHHKVSNIVVFAYQIGETRIQDALGEQDGKLTRWLYMDSDLPKGTTLHARKGFKLDSKDLVKGDLIIDVVFGNKIRTDFVTFASSSSGATPLWQDKTEETRLVLGKDKPYAIDTLTVPYRDANPFKAPMRLSGLGFFEDGRAAVCNLMGDVWIVDGIYSDSGKLTWRRFAAGLNNPGGLVIHKDKIHVICRDQLVLLHDRNGDGEADFYECLTNDFPIGAGNNWALTLHVDDKGSFYWFTRASGFDLTMFDPSSGTPPQSIGNGLRGTNGSGVSPDGSIVFSTVQDGTNTPASAIFEVGGGSYHGFKGLRKEIGPNGYQLPLCYIPRGVDNSSGDLTFLPEDPRLGPLSGRIIGTSFGYCTHYAVLREVVDGHSQGGVIPLPGEFLSGAHRARFNPKDGHLYIVGSDGWQSYAKENGSFQRIRYTGGELILPTEVKAHANGMLLRYGEEVDTSSAQAFAQQWNYLYANAYGSAEYSVNQPGQRGHDPVEVAGVHKVEGGKALFVEMQDITPAMTLHLHLVAKGQAGKTFTTDLYYTPKRLRAPYPGIPTKRKEALLTEPIFPTQANSPEDPRLLAQDRLGRTLGETQKITVKAVAGLKFEPTRLTVQAGKRTAISFINDDPSMAHNLVLVRPESLQKVGEGSMQLASSPEGAAQHFTIDDPGVLGLTPVLQPGGKYDLYFDAPKDPGEYPYICTFPGHWLVTRGVLVVE